MVSKFHPEINQVYFVNEYSLYQVLSGSGSIEVDFKIYSDWKDKIIYLEEGQYIKFLSADFEVRKIVFPSEAVFQHSDFRVLFKHLISLGYINFTECTDCHKYLSNTAFSSGLSNIIDVSSEQWFWQNPFNAHRDEYHLIFDVKDLIDREFQNHLSNRDLAAMLEDRGHFAQALVKDKVGLSVKGLLANKRLLESKKDIAFTDKHISEVAYDLGFKDPAYFNRIFTRETGKTPLRFRSDYDFQNRDLFLQDLVALLHEYHSSKRSLEFYADKMHLSVRALSRKVRDKLNISMGQLIRNELIQTAKKLLHEESSPTEIAAFLGFEESNHFSAFFKHYTGESPTAFKDKKYNS